jgi:hypothetical protein
MQEPRLHCGDASRQPQQAPSIQKHEKSLLKKSFVRRFEKDLEGRQNFQPLRINRGGHFLLTETVRVNRLAKSIYRGG